MKNNFAKDIERIREILKLMEELGGNDPASAQPWLRLQNELESLMNDRVEEWLALTSVAAALRVVCDYAEDQRFASVAKAYDNLMRGPNEG